MAGEVSYTDVVTTEHVLREAQKADITINDKAINAFSDRTNELRLLYMKIYQEIYGPQEDESIVGHLMFTPKHGLGRSPMMHVDNVQLTLHTTFAGATLRLLTGIASETLWKAMNVLKTSALPPEELSKNNDELTRLTRAYVDEFSSVALGDVVIMKGQRGENLDDPETRERVCVHASSPYIPQYGQAGAIFYAKKTRDIEPA